MQFRVQDVLDALVDVGVVIDVDGRIAIANRAAARISGHAQDALVGLPIERLIDDKHNTHGRARESVPDKVTRLGEDCFLVTAAGTRIPVSVVASPLFDDARAFAGVVLVARDLRPDRELERWQHEALEARLQNVQPPAGAVLHHPERGAMYSTLADGVARELDEVAAVLASAPDEVARTADRLAQRARRLHRLARAGADHAQFANVNRVVSDAATLLEGSRLLRRIELVVVLDEHPVLVRIERARIEQVLVNLIVNAAEAMSRAPGKILLAVHAGERVSIEVSDTGPGIPPDVLPRIFDPFFTTHPDDHAGLGLAVARDIIESHGGTLTAATTLGVGSAFTFDLPRGAT